MNARHCDGNGGDAAVGMEEAVSASANAGKVTLKL